MIQYAAALGHLHPAGKRRVLDGRRLRGSVAERCAERGSVVGGAADALGGRKLGLTEMILLIVVVGDVRMDP